MTVLVTGAGGLIGSESVRFFLEKQEEVIGIENDQRAIFFGERGSTQENLNHLRREKGFTNFDTDIRNYGGVLRVFKEAGPFSTIIHTAAQPSHDWAAREPLTDFGVNALGTLHLLEATRLESPLATFIFTSTNKVYGDKPNQANFVEREKRYDFADSQDLEGITSEGVNEKMSLDQTLHSIFGASKVAADVMVQEYGRYFGIKTGVFRGGCLTGPQHAAVEMHGFLAYLIWCGITGREYTIIGYKGKQVRDQIHSRDVINAFWEFAKNPRAGEVYNLGGGKANARSILEIVEMLEKEFGISVKTRYQDQARKGDHKCYYTDMGKFERDYPSWKIRYFVQDIIDEIIKKGKK